MISLRRHQHEDYNNHTTTSCGDQANDNRPSTPDTLQGGVSSASSTDFEFDGGGSPESLQQQEMTRTAGEVSPSAVCQPRRLSAAIVTAEDVEHAYVSGRIKIPVEKLPSPPKTMKLKKVERSISTGGGPPPLPFPASLSKSSSTPSSSVRKHRRISSDSQLPSPSSFGTTTEALRLDAWGEPDATTYSVRGDTYLVDKKKFASEPSVLKLLTVDLVQSPEPVLDGLCNHPNERIQRSLRVEQKTGIQQLPEFIFAVTLVVPGPPFYHMVAYMGTDDKAALQSDNTAWGRIASKFFFGESDEYRSSTFKLIPRIVDGNYIVKKAVGSKPTILGQRLKQRYIRHERFLELIVDIGSNPVANKIVQLTKGYAKSLVVDMMFVLEGKEETELPERVMGGLRLKNIDFKKRDGQRVVHNY